METGGTIICAAWQTVTHSDYLHISFTFNTMHHLQLDALFMPGTRFWWDMPQMNQQELNFCRGRHNSCSVLQVSIFAQKLFGRLKLQKLVCDVSDDTLVIMKDSVIALTNDYHRLSMQFICVSSFGKHHMCLWALLSLVGSKKQETIEEEKLSDQHCTLKAWTCIPSHIRWDTDLFFNTPPPSHPNPVNKQGSFGIFLNWVGKLKNFKRKRKTKREDCCF